MCSILEDTQGKLYKIEIGIGTITVSERQIKGKVEVK